MIYEFVNYIMSFFQKSEKTDENELPKLQQAVPSATKQVKIVSKTAILKK